MAERHEYEALRAALEATINENRGMVGRVKQALDQVAAMDATEPKSDRQDFEKPDTGHDTETVIHKG